jgi:hypothetical protein
VLLMKKLILLFLLMATNAWAACETFTVAPSPTSTDLIDASDYAFRYLLVQNVSSVASGCEVVCALGTGNTVTFPNGTLLFAHGGAWIPQPPIPMYTDLACSANACTAQVTACWW